MTLSARPFSCARHGRSQAEPGTASTRRSTSAATCCPGSSGTDFSFSGSQPLGLERRHQLDVEKIAGGQPPDLYIGQGAGRGEIVLGAVVDAGAAALKDRRQQQERLTLRGADDDLAAASGELRPPFGHLARRVHWRRTATGRRLCLRGLDFDGEPGLVVEPLPQRGVIAGELELRRTVQLQYHLFRGVREIGRHHRRHHRHRRGDRHDPRHRAPRLATHPRAVPRHHAATTSLYPKSRRREPVEVKRQW